MPNGRIRSFYLQARYQHSHETILSISDNGALTIYSFASCLSYVPIGCRHPFMQYWQPSLAKTTATCYLRHPENECLWSINSFRSWIFHKQGIARILVWITLLLSALIGKNTIYWWWNTDTKLTDIANCSTSKTALLVAKNPILIRYYSHPANTRALYESIDGPAGQPADNLPNSDWKGVYHWTVQEWAVWVNWLHGQPIWQMLRFRPGPGPEVMAWNCC